MTSGNFTSLEISSITVDRIARQRRELVGIDELAQSISDVGLINPIIVDENNTLIAGERRYTACLQLGWTHIPVQYADTISEDRLYLIELEENVKRVDLEWQDQCRAVKSYHAMLSQTKEEEWSIADSCKALGISPTEGRYRIRVAQALEDGNKLVCEADKYSVARGIVERQAQRQEEETAAESSDAMDAMLSGAPAPKEPYTIVPEDTAEEAPSPVEPSSPTAPMLCTDFNEWAASYSGPRFNFIHCDFPYGINAGKHDQGSAQSLGGYDDSEDIYWMLLQTLHNHIDTLAADSAHMMFWFSMDYYQETLDALTEMGWKVNPFPLVWDKEYQGILPDPKRGPRRCYETAFLCTRGDRYIVQSVANIKTGKLTKETHMSEKSKEVLAHFFRMFVDSSTTMLDPTMGSGHAVQMAQAAGAKSVLGLELNPEYHARAVDAYLAAQEGAGES